MKSGKSMEQGFGGGAVQMSKRVGVCLQGPAKNRLWPGAVAQWSFSGEIAAV